MQNHPDGFTKSSYSYRFYMAWTESGSMISTLWSAKTVFQHCLPGDLSYTHTHACMCVCMRMHMCSISEDSLQRPQWIIACL